MESLMAIAAVRKYIDTGGEGATIYYQNNELESPRYKLVLEALPDTTIGGHTIENVDEIFRLLYVKATGQEFNGKVQDFNTV